MNKIIIYELSILLEYFKFHKFDERKIDSINGLIQKVIQDDINYIKEDYFENKYKTMTSLIYGGTDV